MRLIRWTKIFVKWLTPSKREPRQSKHPLEIGSKFVCLSSRLSWERMSYRVSPPKSSPNRGETGRDLDQNQQMMILDPDIITTIIIFRKLPIHISPYLIPFLTLKCSYSYVSTVDCLLFWFIKINYAYCKLFIVWTWEGQFS